MKKSTILFFWGIALTGFLQAKAFSQNFQKKPNVIVILTDDQGTLDMNSYGSDDLITPNMDAMSASGVRFTQFYAAAPVCSPSRAVYSLG